MGTASARSLVQMLRLHHKSGWRGLPLTPALGPRVSHANFQALLKTLSSLVLVSVSACQRNQSVHLIIFVMEPEPVLSEPWRVGRERAEVSEMKLLFQLSVLRALS